MPEAAGEDKDARPVPIGAGAGLRCLVCGATEFWRRYPKAVDRTDQLLLLAEDAADQAFRDLREHHRWQGFAEVCATCGFVHWFSSEATRRRQSG